MKLRQLLKDFDVEEVSKFDISNKRRSFKLYMLEKRGLETFSLFRYLAKQNHIPMPVIGYAGLKDRHAMTRQYFTIPERYEIRTLKEKNFDITFLGYVNKGIRLGELEGNRFKITVRDVRKGELKGIYDKAKEIGAIGVPNYFDSQRFGSVIAGKFIAKLVIQKNYEEAVKMYLTRYSKHENKELKNEKRLIFQNWDKLTQLELKHSSLYIIINEYKKTKSWLSTYRKIPDYLKEMYISAYQSYLWNECIKEIFKENLDKRDIYYIEYNIGSLLFYKKLNNKIPISFPSLGDNMKLSEYEQKIMNRILEREKLTFKDFNIKKETGQFFVTRSRKVIIKPTEFEIKEPEIDELNDRGKKNRFKIALAFTLAKGIYATIITKALFRH